MNRVQNASICGLLAIALMASSLGCTTSVWALEYIPEDTSDWGTTNVDVPDVGMPDAQNTGLDDDVDPNWVGADSEFYYTVTVCSANEGAPISGARVTLYQDGARADARSTDASGQASWLLPAGAGYSASASKTGFEPAENSSYVGSLLQDVFCEILLIRAEPEPTAQPEPTEEPEPTTGPTPTEEPESTTELEPSTEPEPAAELELTAEPEPAADLEPTAEPEPATELELTAELEPTTEPESAAEPESTADPEPTTELELTAELEPTTEPEPAVELEQAAEPKPTAEPEPTKTPASVVIEVESPDGEAVQSETPQPENGNQATTIEIGRQVTITAPEVTVTAGDPVFDVLTGVSAMDQDGNAVAVYVLDLGGFDVNIPGVYTVKYAAMQGDDEIAVSRQITVVATTEGPFGEDLLDEPIPEIDPSSELYRQRLRHKDEIQARLLSETAQIQEQLRATISALTNGERVRYLRVETVHGSVSESAFTVNTKRYEQVELAEVLNWGELLACFAAQSGLTIHEPFDLLDLRDISFSGLSTIAARAISITLQTGADGTDALIDTLPIANLAAACGLDAEQIALLERLLQPEYQRVLAALMQNASYNDLSADEAAAILATLPEGISEERKHVVLEARSLLGQVQYLWGGKYNRIGWNPDWGLSTRGQSGLDCSGFVSWAFINAYQDDGALALVGNGSSNQWGRSTHVDWADAQVGDLTFIAAPGAREINHIGIIASVEPDGTYLVIHCSSSKHGVVLTEAWESGFRFVRRPNIYET